MKNNVTSVFADRLQDLIEQSGETIGALSSAEKIGISSGSLSKYQNDAAEPGITALVKIADYFGVSFDYLLGKTENKENGNADIGNITGLSDKSIEVLKDFVDFKKAGSKLINGCKKCDMEPIDLINMILEDEDFDLAICEFCVSTYDKKQKEIPENKFNKLSDECHKNYSDSVEVVPMEVMAMYEFNNAKELLAGILDNVKWSIEEDDHEDNEEGAINGNNSQTR